MPMKLEGSCRCGAVHFTVESHTPVPYQLCYCSICRKTAGGGGFAINLGGIADSLVVRGREALAVYRAKLGEGDHLTVSTAERNFCAHCGSALWLYDPTWPDLVHPFASAIDSELPEAPERVHLMLEFRASWVPLPSGPGETHFARYPDLSLEDWHRRHGLWVE
jgi:hypothetical protein